jgi:hypothetical protein
MSKASRMKTLKRKKPLARKGIFVVSSKVLENLPRRHGRLTPVRDRPAIRQVMNSGEVEAWVVADAQAASDLLAEASAAKVSKRRLGRLVFLEPPRLESLAAALDLFRSVAWANDRKRWLPMEELIEVLNTPDPREYLVGGMVDAEAGTLTLYRGDFSRLRIPLSIFQPTAKGVQIDPAQFEVIDCGHAVRLGAYEAGADAIFYECDPAYRKRLRRQRRAEEKTFGASFRRLRIQRGLRQGDFTPLTAKTIARIEHGEVQKPHGKTLTRIADRLGVAPEEIESY